MTTKKKDDNEKQISYYYIESKYRGLAGEILTMADAAFADKEQRKAFKDMVKNKIRQELWDWQDYFWEGKQGHSINLAEDEHKILT